MISNSGVKLSFREGGRSGSNTLASHWVFAALRTPLNMVLGPQSLVIWFHTTQYSPGNPIRHNLSVNRSKFGLRLSLVICRILYCKKNNFCFQISKQRHWSGVWRWQVHTADFHRSPWLCVQWSLHYQDFLAPRFLQGLIDSARGINTSVNLLFPSIFSRSFQNRAKKTILFKFRFPQLCLL